MMSENQSRRVLGEHKVVESIQSIADWVTKAKKVMSDIKSNKVDYNFYEITSDLEEDIARTDSDIEKEVLTGLLHSLNNAYSKVADKDDKEDIREDKEILVEDDIKVGDKIKIVYYNNHPDEDLLAWADEQNTDIFEVSEVDNDSKVFYIKDCEYGIPFDSDDYITVNKKVTENEEDIPKLKVGDKVKIYSADDDELNYWLDDQNTDIFEVEDIDMENGCFWVKGCDYSVDMMTDDWKLVKESITEAVEEDLTNMSKEEFKQWVMKQYEDVINNIEKFTIAREYGPYKTWGVFVYWKNLVNGRRPMPTYIPHPDKHNSDTLDTVLNTIEFDKEEHSYLYESKKVTEAVEEDLGEDFYEKICRAYIDTMNLEWVTTNPENYDSVVHGYFANNDVAEKWEYGAKVTPENFKDIAYEGYTEEEIENGDVDWYEYETWEDFYNDYVKENIEYDINDIGVYDFNDNWDFYISEEDLTKLGLWNEDIKSEFLDESKKSYREYII